MYVNVSTYKISQMRIETPIVVEAKQYKCIPATSY